MAVHFSILCIIVILTNFVISVESGAAKSLLPKVHPFFIRAAAKRTQTDQTSGPVTKKLCPTRKIKNDWFQLFAPWLEKEDKEYGPVLSCKFCKAAPNVAGTSQFITGCTMFKKDTLQKHQMSAKHISCSNIFFEGKKHVLEKVVQRVNTKLDEATHKDLSVKFSIAYTIAKTETAFTHFEPWVLTHAKNGVAISKTYCNEVSCAKLVATIAETIEDDLAKCIKEARYISILCDGGTDKGIVENEVVCVKYVSKEGLGRTDFVSFVPVEHAHADGVLDAIDHAFTNLQMSEREVTDRLIGFTADGASVNMGVKQGVQAKLKRRTPSLIEFWCMPHKLEIAVTKMLKDCNYVATVIEILDLIYKTYHFSPKSRRGLQAIAHELNLKAHMPTRVKGTRWLPHVRRALAVLLATPKSHSDEDPGQYAAVLMHMEHLSATHTNAEIKGRAKKVVKEMVSLKFLTFCHFMLDVYSHLSVLSLSLQGRQTILPSAIARLFSSIANIESLLKTPGDSIRVFQDVLRTQSNNNEDVHTCEYQGHPMKGDSTCFTGAISSFPTQILNKMKQLVQSTVSHLKSGFENLLGQEGHLEQQSKRSISSKAVYHLAHCFNIDSWPSDHHMLVDYGNNEIRHLLDFFRSKLEDKGCDMILVLNQWRALKTLVSMQMKHCMDFNSVWATLLSKAPYKEDFKDVLHLVEIMLVIPISSAECERMFSAMKRVKSDERCSLASSTLDNLVRISKHGPNIEAFDPSKAIDKWLISGQRPRLCTYTAWPTK